MADLRFDLPVTDSSTERFWEALGEGKLLIKRCQDCDRAHFYPRPFCPHCWSDAVEWADASGRGTVYTYPIIRRNDLPPFPSRVPYAAAIVELEEGPRLMTNLVDCPLDDVRVGMPVEVDCRRWGAGDTDELTLPYFRPAGGK